MKKIVVMVGTVPEAVKLGPVCRALAHHATVQTHVILSGQHRDRVRQILELFGIQPSQTLADDITRDTLSTMAASLIAVIAELLTRLKPNLVVVQGDTATAFAAALAAFYEQVPVAHVEAGLTTGNVEHPFPEELHRETIGKVATLLLAPSERSAEHARRIARPGARVFQTGNPCVDALVQICDGKLQHESRNGIAPHRKQILVTVHRRENHGRRGQGIGRAIARLAAERTDAEVVFVGHNHPGLSPITDALRASNRVTVLPPQGYVEWIGLLQKCHFVLSDSGGAQEEAPWLGKPVLVLRDETERPEVIEAGAAKLVGGDPGLIFETASMLLDDECEYRRMQIDRSKYPYGDGSAARQVVRHVLEWLEAN